MDIELKETSREQIREARLQFGDDKGNYELIFHNESGEVIDAMNRMVEEYRSLRELEKRAADIEGMAGVLQEGGVQEFQAKVIARGLAAWLKEGK